MAGGPPLRRLSQQRVRVYTLDPHVCRLQHPGLQTSRQRCRFVAGGDTPGVRQWGWERGYDASGRGGGARALLVSPRAVSIECGKCKVCNAVLPCTRTKGFWTHARNPYCPRGGALARSVGAAWQGSPKDAPNRLPGFPASSEGTLVARLLWSPASLTRDRPLWSGALGFTILPLQVGPGDFAVG